MRRAGLPPRIAFIGSSFMSACGAARSPRALKVNTPEEAGGWTRLARLVNRYLAEPRLARGVCPVKIGAIADHDREVKLYSCVLGPEIFYEWAILCPINHHPLPVCAHPVVGARDHKNKIRDILVRELGKIEDTLWSIGCDRREGTPSARRID